jgi:hypothetical protein
MRTSGFKGLVMTLASEMLDRADRYLRSDSELSELDLWLAQRARDISRLPSDEPMARLAGLIAVSVAELNDRVIPEDELRARIAGFIANYGDRFSVANPAPPRPS